MLSELNKPLIGVTLGLAKEDHRLEDEAIDNYEFLKRQYYESLEDQDAVVLPLPNTRRIEHTDYYIEFIDGLLLVGGADISPTLYGAEKSELTHETDVRRDYFERELTFKAVTKRIPILGICRGHQMINVVYGGSLIQDLSLRRERTLDHRQTPARDYSNHHAVELAADSRLGRALGQKEARVNSSHHQLLDRIPAGLRATAFAPDGAVEALEGTDSGYIQTVQWHPEVEPELDVSLAIFADFVRAAREFKRSRT